MSTLQWQEADAVSDTACMAGLCAVHSGREYRVTELPGLGWVMAVTYVDDLERRDGLPATHKFPAQSDALEAAQAVADILG